MGKESALGHDPLRWMKITKENKNHYRRRMRMQQVRMPKRLNSRQVSRQRLNKYHFQEIMVRLRLYQRRHHYPIIEQITLQHLNPRL